MTNRRSAKLRYTGIFIAGILLLLYFSGSALSRGDHGKTIPVAQDFSELARQAKAKQIPIMLMVSQDHCPFCVLLKTDVLNPMMISGDYDDKVVMTELLIDVGDSVIDFDGKKVYPGKIASDYNTWVTPTLLFLDHQGKEVHKRMLGVNTIEMYGYYLDESLAAALSAVKKGEPYSYKSNKQDQMGTDPHYDY